LEDADRIAIPGLLAVLGAIGTHVVSHDCQHSWARLLGKRR
jgi:hypothetical protein